MKNSRPEHFRAVRLTVAEVDRILETLRGSRVLRTLDGSQRQQLDEVIEQLAEARSRPKGRQVEIGPQIVLQILRLVSLSQVWLEQLFAEFVVEPD